MCCFQLAHGALMESRLNDRQVSRLSELAWKLTIRGSLPPLELYELGELERDSYRDLADEERRLRKRKTVANEPDESEVAPPLPPADRARLEAFLQSNRPANLLPQNLLTDYISLVQQASRHLVTLNRWLNLLPDASEVHPMPCRTATTAPIKS